jgi:ankyrin repeat protein
LLLHDDADSRTINVVDSKGRTALDLAALTGQMELLCLIENKGGQFKFKNASRMKAIASKRAPHSAAFIKHVCDHVE